MEARPGLMTVTTNGGSHQAAGGGLGRHFAPAHKKLQQPRNPSHVNPTTKFKNSWFQRCTRQKATETKTLPF